MCNAYMMDLILLILLIAKIFTSDGNLKSNILRFSISTTWFLCCFYLSIDSFTYSFIYLFLFSFINSFLFYWLIYLWIFNFYFYFYFYFHSHSYSFQYFYFFLANDPTRKLATQSEEALVSAFQKRGSRLSIFIYFIVLLFHYFYCQRYFKFNFNFKYFYFYFFWF